MTRLSETDIIKYILKIQLNFENAYRFNSDFERGLLIESWLDILGKYPKEVCDTAVNNALSKAKFAPRLGDITEEIKFILNAKSKTDEELWSELEEIKYRVYEISRYLSYQQHYANAMLKLNKIYNDLSEELKTFLVNVSGMIAFSELSAEQLPFEKNRFFKNISSIRKRNEERIAAQTFIESANKKLIDNKDKK